MAAIGRRRWRGVNLASDQYVVQSISNTEVMRIVSTGMVGIGTSTPTTPLEVSGAIKIAGNGTEACGPVPTAACVLIRHGRLQICSIPITPNMRV